MPAPAGQPQQPRSATLIERSFKTLNLSSGPTALRDGEFLELENLMPYADGHLAVFPGPKQVATAPTGMTIAAVWAFVLGSTSYLIAQMADGSVSSQVVGSGTWSTLAAAGGTTVNGLHMTKWQATDGQGNPEAVLWVDTVKGYGSYTGGTTWTVLQATQTGQCLAVYAGRVWIGSGQQITYTAPDAYNDFLAADYAGAFKITDPSMNGPIIALFGTQNWLYIIGSGMMALNNVQVQNVAGSSALSTTFFVTPVSSAVGIVTDRAAMVLDNVLFLVTNTGLWGFLGLNGRNLTSGMGDNFDGSQSLFSAQVYGRNLIVTSAGYNLMVNDRQWFATTADSVAWVSTCTENLQGITGYAATSTAIYRIGGDLTTPRKCVAHTKLWDAGNGTVNKRVINAGFELFQDGLQATPPTGRTVSGTWRLRGYKVESQAATFGALDVTQNQWVRGAASMTDRYFGFELDLTAPPSCAIGAFMVQFQESTEWP